jgi:hypothetical protein
MFLCIGLQATATEIYYMICQSYWKMYYWWSEHEFGTCMMALRHILVVLRDMFSPTPIMTDGSVEGDQLHDLQARQFESSAFLPLGRPKIPCACRL